MFIIFNTQKQAINYIRRNKQLNYFHDEGCGCCDFSGSAFIDGNKVVQCHKITKRGYTTASAIIIGKIKSR